MSSETTTTRKFADQTLMAVRANTKGLEEEYKHAIVFIHNASSFGLESHKHVTRMIASDWSQVQNMMECNRRCHWGLPTIHERSPTLKSYTRWQHIPSVSHI